jgi:hypothetical protein
MLIGNMLGAIQQFCSIPYTTVSAGRADAGGLTAPLSATLSTSAPPAAGMRAAPFRSYGLLSPHLSYRSTPSLSTLHLAVLVSPPHRSRRTARAPPLRLSSSIHCPTLAQ